jgi:hypothetical protein
VNHPLTAARALQPRLAGPIGWLMKILAALGKTVYWIVRIVLWFLRRKKR